MKTCDRYKNINDEILEKDVRDLNNTCYKNLADIFSINKRIDGIENLIRDNSNRIEDLEDDGEDDLEDCDYCPCCGKKNGNYSLCLFTRINSMRLGFRFCSRICRSVYIVRNGI